MFTKLKFTNLTNVCAAVLLQLRRSRGGQIQRVSFIAHHSTPALSHRKPASAATSRYSCGVLDSDKRYAQ
jgi:hypothetical protein